MDSGTQDFVKWKRAAADEEKDADEAVVYPDGIDDTDLWIAARPGRA